MYQEHLKEQLNIGIELPKEFYQDLLLSEINIIYYGEKIASILYKRLDNQQLSLVEKKHQKIIKRIIKKPQPLDPRIFLFFKTILKSRSDHIYIAFLKSLEHYSIFRYKTIIENINDKKIKKILNGILKDELKHFVHHSDLEYQSNFHGFENKKLFLKYQNVLNIDYLEFKKRIWMTPFYQKIRGIF